MTLQALLNLMPSDCSQPDKGLVLIEACIEQGIDTRKGILDALVELEFNYRFVAIMLNKNTGNNPDRHRWRRDEAGRYYLLS